MLRILFVFLGLTIGVILIYLGISIGVQYASKLGRFLSNVFTFKKFNFNFLNVIDEVKDHNVTPSLINDRKRKFHAPSLLEFDFFNSQYELLNGLGYSCDLPLEKRYLNASFASEIGKIVFFTNEISESFTESHDRIPDHLKSPLNIHCLGKKFSNFNDQVFLKFFMIFSKEKLKSTNKKELESYSDICDRSHSGWITPNAVLQAYSYGVHLMNFLDSKSGNKTASFASIKFEVSKLPRIHLYSQFVLASMKYAQIIKLNNRSVYNKMISEESFDFSGSEDLSKIFHFKTSSLSNFCEPSENCNCPRLRFLYNSIGLSKAAIMSNAEDDLRLVHSKLINILENSPKKANVEGLMRILREYFPGELSWLRSSLNLFLYEIHLGDGSQGIINSIHALNTNLICKIPTTTEKSNSIEESPLSQKCIPQEIINWLWKADITIGQIYVKTKDFIKYSKLLIFPLLLRIQTIAANMNDTPDKYSMNLFGANADILEYFLSALEVPVQGREKRALPPPTSISWSFSRLSSVKKSSSNQQLFFSLSIDDKDVTRRLPFCEPNQEQCLFSRLIDYISSENGYWSHFNSKKTDVNSMYGDSYYSAMCQ